MDRLVDRLIDLLRTRGTRQYAGERVSQCEHASQSALLASRENAPTALIAAALLHGDRDRGTPRGATPPTPPGIRVRTTAVRSG